MREDVAKGAIRAAGVEEGILRILNAFQLKDLGVRSITIHYDAFPTAPAENEAGTILGVPIFVEEHHA